MIPSSHLSIDILQHLKLDSRSAAVRLGLLEHRVNFMMSSCIHVSLPYHGTHPEVHVPGHLDVLEEGVAGQGLGGDGHGLLVTVSPPGGKMALCHDIIIFSSSMLGCHVVMGLYGMSA